MRIKGLLRRTIYYAQFDVSVDRAWCISYFRET
jgi:hypothetical protein